jgi:hypothetical protein
MVSLKDNSSKYCCVCKHNFKLQAIARVILQVEWMQAIKDHILPVCTDTFILLFSYICSILMPAFCRYGVSEGQFIQVLLLCVCEHKFMLQAIARVILQVDYMQAVKDYIPSVCTDTFILLFSYISSILTHSFCRDGVIEGQFIQVLLFV